MGNIRKRPAGPKRGKKDDLVTSWTITFLLTMTLEEKWNELNVLVGETETLQDRVRDEGFKYGHLESWRTEIMTGLMNLGKRRVSLYDEVKTIVYLRKTIMGYHAGKKENDVPPWIITLKSMPTM